MAASGNRKVSLDSSPYRSRNAVENRAMEASGVTQNRLSYTPVSSTEADDTFVSIYKLWWIHSTALRPAQFPYVLFKTADSFTDSNYIMRPSFPK